MARTKEQIEKARAERLAKREAEALKILQDTEVAFIDELCVKMNISRQTFYNDDLDKLDSIKNALLANKVNDKTFIRNEWKKSKQFIKQLAYYKLVATNEELERLTLQRLHTSDGDDLPIPEPIQFYDPDKQDIDLDLDE